MHVFLTGGAGFVGSHVAESLLRDGHQVTLVDNFDPFYPRDQKHANLAGIRRHPCLRVVEADIRDLCTLYTLSAHYDVIVHLAAKVGVRHSLVDPVAYRQVNVTGTQNLLELAREWGVEQFVFASSSSVYGNNPRMPWREDDPDLLPISPYAQTKISCERLGEEYSQLHGIRFLALRFFTVYGPRQRPDLAIRKFAELILAGHPVPIYGTGLATRDYSYVDDVVDAIRAAMEYHQTPFEIVNISGGQPIALLEVVRTLEDLLGRKAKLDFHDAQKGDVADTHADCAKAARLLNYRPKTSFHEGLSHFLSYLSSAL